jgi:hypothetical protein
MGFRIVSREHDDRTFRQRLVEWSAVDTVAHVRLSGGRRSLPITANGQIDAGRIERTLCPPWMMERVNLLDQLFKNRLRSRFGWNLIVAEKTTTGPLEIDGLSFS